MLFRSSYEMEVRVRAIHDGIFLVTPVFLDKRYRNDIFLEKWRLTALKSRMMSDSTIVEVIENQKYSLTANSNCCMKICLKA